MCHTKETIHIKCGHSRFKTIRCHEAKERDAQCREAPTRVQMYPVTFCSKECEEKECEEAKSHQTSAENTAPSPS